MPAAVAPSPFSVPRREIVLRKIELESLVSVMRVPLVLLSVDYGKPPSA